ncbi:MAG: hypothetical protein ACFFD4_09920 [Candidatus Odinarchaeota archaeon]
MSKARSTTLYTDDRFVTTRNIVDEIEKVSTLSLDDLLKQFGSNWRWGLFVKITSLMNKLNITNVAENGLAFTADFREELAEHLTDEEVDKFFQALYKMIGNLCMVNPRIIPQQLVDDVDTDSYHIGIN